MENINKVFDLGNWLLKIVIYNYGDTRYFIVSAQDKKTGLEVGVDNLHPKPFVSRKDLLGFYRFDIKLILDKVGEELPQVELEEEDILL